MESKTYKVKNGKGAEVSLVLEATDGRPLPTDEAVQAWHESHGRPRIGSFANCQTPRIQITLSGRGGVAMPFALAKLGPGDYPPIDKVQKWYEANGYATGKDCVIEGCAPCCLATF